MHVLSDVSVTDSQHGGMETFLHHDGTSPAPTEAFDAYFTAYRFITRIIFSLKFDERLHSNQAHCRVSLLRLGGTI